MQGEFLNEEKCKEWIHNFDDVALVQAIDNLERLSDTEAFNESIIFDEGMDLLMMMYAECVERLRVRVKPQ